MKIARILLFLPGLAALAWGAKLFTDYALPVRPDVLATLTWLVGGPILHDAVVAPVAAIAGLALAKVIPRPWRTPVMAATTATAVLAILAFPLIWRTYGTPPEPGLHDGNTPLGLALTVAAVWVVIAAVTVARRSIRRKPTPPSTVDGH